jgi:hypothetical protein
MLSLEAIRLTNMCSKCSHMNTEVFDLRALIPYLPAEHGRPSRQASGQKIEDRCKLFVDSTYASSLDDIVLSVVEECLILEDRVIHACKHDNRYMLCPSALFERPKDFHPIHPGHADIEQDDVDATPEGESESFFAILCMQYLVPEGRQALVERSPDIFVVINCEYVGHAELV